MEMFNKTKALLMPPDSLYSAVHFDFQVFWFKNEFCKALADIDSDSFDEYGKSKLNQGLICTR
jgi:hypothetical protein